MNQERRADGEMDRLCPTVKRVCCEVAWAEPACQRLVTVSLAPGSNAFDAIEASGLLAEVEALAGIPPERLALGVFSRRLASPAEYRVQAGDRIEIYRPLLIDPRQARRARARRDR